MMQEVKTGDTVLLYHSDGSATPRLVVNVISSTEVQLFDFETRASVFDAATAPTFIRGIEAGQWELMNEEPPEELKRFGEGLRMANHPITRMLHSLLNIKLSTDVEEVFSMIGRIYADKNIRSPFYEVRHRDQPYRDDDYFYNLFTMGVQEGLRSTFYFLQQFLKWAEAVKVQGAAIVADVKPSYRGTFGIHTPVLTSEYEAFMLLSRATLDRLNYAFKYYFQINPRKRISNLYKLTEELSKNDPGNKHAQGLMQVINQHRSYLDAQFTGLNQSTERNRLAHQEYVGFTSPNIIYSPDGTTRVVLIYKGDLKVDGAEELIDRFNKLQLFIIDILNEFFANSSSET